MVCECLLLALESSKQRLDKIKRGVATVEGSISAVSIPLFSTTLH